VAATQNTYTLIEKAVEQAHQSGLRITRAAFVHEAGQLTGVCWVGAILWMHGRQRLDPGWLPIFLDILGKDSYFFWRYNCGFSLGQSRMTYIVERDGKDVHVPDEVSRRGFLLAKRYGLYR
jgi:hypothetical protein